jgi:beta-glucanase (GH16 family)
LTFYFDGAQMGSTPTPAVMKQPYFILVDLGMGGGWPTDQTPNPSDMQVQYVKAYQNKSSLP